MPLSDEQYTLHTYQHPHLAVQSELEVETLFHPVQNNFSHDKHSMCVRGYICVCMHIYA